MTKEQLDAYENALAAERALAHGTGDEDDIDHWMAHADES